MYRSCGFALHCCNDPDASAVEYAAVESVAVPSAVAGSVAVRSVGVGIVAVQSVGAEFVAVRSVADAAVAVDEIVAVDGGAAAGIAVVVGSVDYAIDYAVVRIAFVYVVSALQETSVAKDEHFVVAFLVRH